MGLKLILVAKNWVWNKISKNVPPDNLERAVIRMISLSLVVILASCAPSENDQPLPRDVSSVAESGPPQSVLNVNPIVENLSRRSQREQAVLLAAVATDDEFTCESDGRSMYMGATDDGQAFFSVGCRAGDQMVSIKPSDDNSVLPCEFARQMDIDCWQTMN